MLTCKAYAAQSATTPVAPFTIERRNPRPADIVFDILYCGVCHSDLHQVRGEWRNSIFPMVPGHEIVGRVTEVGSGVNRFKPGDFAAVGCLVDSCRTCKNCQRGLEQYCLNGNSGTYNSYEQDKITPTYGGYSKSIVVHEDFALQIADTLPLAATAPLLCAGITTWSPLRHWKVGPGHKVGVLGLGGLGHMAVKFAAAFGAEVTVLSTSPSKEADARRLGAHHFLLTTDAAQTRRAKGTLDFIIDTVSAAHDYNLYLSLLDTDGVHICVGAPPDPAQVKVFSLIGGRKSIAGSGIGGIPETQEMLDFCAASNLVSDVEIIDIKDIEMAYARMLKGDVRYRFVIDMATL